MLKPTANAQAPITAKHTPDDPAQSLLLTGLATLADVLQHEVDELRARRWRGQHRQRTATRRGIATPGRR